MLTARLLAPSLFSCLFLFLQAGVIFLLNLLFTKLFSSPIHLLFVLWISCFVFMGGVLNNYDTRKTNFEVQFPFFLFFFIFLKTYDMDFGFHLLSLRVIF